MQSLSSPIQLGPITLRNRLLSGPLAGYSCAPFRVLTERFSQPGFCATEMISGHDLEYRKPKRFLWRDPREHTVCYQISGYNPDKLAYAAETVTQHGADIIDLNCGCPVKKIRKRGHGSKLLHDPEGVFKAIAAIKSATDKAVTIKVRVASPKDDFDDAAAIQAAEAAGVDGIIIHGRHWTERYDVPSQLARIKYLASKVSVPVFANGDVSDTASALSIMQDTGVDGLMIARATVGQPWLIAQILLESQGLGFQKPSLLEVGELFIEHLYGLRELDNEILAVLQARKLVKYYVRGSMPNAKDFIVRVQQCGDFGELISLIKKSFLL